MNRGKFLAIEHLIAISVGAWESKNHRKCQILNHITNAWAVLNRVQIQNVINFEARLSFRNQILPGMKNKIRLEPPEPEMPKNAKWWDKVDNFIKMCVGPCAEWRDLLARRVLVQCCIFRAKRALPRRQRSSRTEPRRNCWWLNGTVRKVLTLNPSMVYGLQYTSHFG